MYKNVCVCVHVCLYAFNHSVVSDTFANPWTIVCQAAPSTGFPRQEYCSLLPFLSPGDLPNPGIEPKSLVSPAVAGRFFTTVPPRKPNV